MNVVLWIAASVLALAAIGAGGMKLATSKDALVEKGMPALAGYSPNAIRAIGAAEVLGGIGLILPAVLHVAPVLVPLAAVGLAVVMAGAVVVHLRRREVTGALPAAVLLVLAVVVAVGRFGAWAF